MKYDADDARITAYLFDELEPDERAAFETELHRKPELRELIEQTRSTVDMLRAEFATREKLSLSEEQRSAIQIALSSESRNGEVSQIGEPLQEVRPRRSRLLRFVALGAVAATVLFLVSFITPVPQQLAQRAELISEKPSIEKLDQVVKQTVPLGREAELAIPNISVRASVPLETKESLHERVRQPTSEQTASDSNNSSQPVPLEAGEAKEANYDKLVDLIETTVEPDSWEEVGGEGTILEFPGTLSLVVSGTPETSDTSENQEGGTQQTDSDPFEFDEGLEQSNESLEPNSRQDRESSIQPFEGELSVVVENMQEVQEHAESAPADGLDASVVKEGKTVSDRFETLEKRGLSRGKTRFRRFPLAIVEERRVANEKNSLDSAIPDRPDHGVGPGQGGDKFDLIVENDFLRVTDAPLSTFSIDVDTASYSKVRMFLNEHHQLPRPDAVRIEELINYFSYNYAPPTSDDPFAAHLAVTACPWNSKHKLVRIGIKGKEIRKDNRPQSNLVFLLDVSGSMNEPNKLPLLKRGMKMLADQLSENDRVAIVVYAGAAGMVLDSTTGDRKSTIAAALERLNAGGSTNGGEGIQLAYQTALDHFIKGGVNRVILCTDGDFNVGTTGTDELVRLVEQHAKSGVFLSVLGFGMGNHNDAMLEQISNKGNGNYAFVDTDREAKKVLVEQMSATLVTIAKDVKIQVEFNPAKVSAYRLIGYENRVLAAQDFNDDTKDAGEIGAGHTVTALYEVVPTGQGASVSIPPVDELKYQAPKKSTQVAGADELLTLKLRYKQPDGDISKLLTFPLTDSDQTFNNADRDFQFAAAVASYGMLLRDSKYKGNATYSAVLEIATPAAQNDETGYRTEFLDLVRAAAILAGQPKD